MLKESPKDKPTNQLEQNTVEVPQVQNEQGHREDDTDFPVPQTTEDVTHLSAKYITKLNDSGVDKTMTYRDESQRRATENTSRKELSILSESSLRSSRTKKWME